MLAQWVRDKDDLHRAKRQLSVLGNIVVLHMQVETLGESCWDWTLWEQSGYVRQQYGRADTLDEAKAWTEGAVNGLAWEYILVVSASCARTRSEMPELGPE